MTTPISGETARAQRANSTSDGEVDLDLLVKKAQLCKLATKTVGCCCLPITWVCNIGCFLCTCCPSIFMSDHLKELIQLPADGCCDSGEEDPASHKKFSNWSAFEGADCQTLPRRPPKVCLDRIQHIFDPLVCLFCYAKKETAQHYLSFNDQVQLIQLIETLKKAQPGSGQYGPERQFIDERKFISKVRQMVD